MIIRKAERFIVAGLFLSMLGCVTPSEPSAPSDGPSSPPDEVDPAIYSRQHDPDDPFAYKYAEFRARRERDMASAESPRPLERYPAFHRTSEQPWGDIERILPFDWEAIRAADPDAASGLEETVRLRIAFDHPDLKITQLMIGAGGVLPAHADGAPGAYIVVGGGGEITVEGETERVSPGATVKLEPYAIRRLAASEQQALRVLWIRWAPGGDQAYIDAGYYLTGANQHLQPRQATMPDGYLFWGKAFDSERVSEPGAAVVPAEEGSFFERSAVALDAVRASLGAGREARLRTG
jgi:quercetin dioxygenase-like cupin family protein